MTEKNTEGYAVKHYSGPVKRFCRTLDLKDSPELIAEYRRRHAQDGVWKEVLDGIRQVGILEMEIYILGTRLFMIVETPLDFEWDEAMAAVVAELNVPYVLTHSMGLAGEAVGYDNFMPQVLQRLAAKMWQLRQAGVADVIVDPGFGFGKSVEQNYRMLSSLRDFEMLDAPLLVGLSRKSMITRLLDIEAGDALAATTALNLVAVRNGADILRVHDVKEAVQAVELARALDFDK